MSDIPAKPYGHEFDPIHEPRKRGRPAVIEMVPKPHIVKRACGGYLATSPKQARFLIGVAADSEADAESKFWHTYVRWCETVPLTDEERGFLGPNIGCCPCLPKRGRALSATDTSK